MFVTVRNLESEDREESLRMRRALRDDGPDDQQVSAEFHAPTATSCSYHHSSKLRPHS